MLAPMDNMVSSLVEKWSVVIGMISVNAQDMKNCVDLKPLKY